MEKLIQKLRLIKKQAHNYPKCCAIILVGIATKLNNIFTYVAHNAKHDSYGGIGESEEDDENQTSIFAVITNEVVAQPCAVKSSERKNIKNYSNLCCFLSKEVA